MKTKNFRVFCLILVVSSYAAQLNAQPNPDMYFSDSTNDSNYPNAKDPDVIFFKGRYIMYYSVSAYRQLTWRIGIAESSDLTHWKKTGEMKPEAAYEQNGICAAGALVKNKQVHLFYQTYGNGKKDAICHAVSTDGVHFTRDETNPVFHPVGNWTCGRAIDAEVIKFKNQYLLYFATRDTSFTIQKIGVAACSSQSSFERSSWRQLTDSAILHPQLPWEETCIEAPSCIKRKDGLYMFYAGAYNNVPQQIGVAFSKDGIRWKRLFTSPFFANGKPGSWNESESGHPCIFQDEKGITWLFFQGNNTKGKTWFISKKQIVWKDNMPQLAD